MKFRRHPPTLLDKFIMDNHGKIATWQKPNIPIIGWIVFTVIAHFLHAGHLKSGMIFIASAFLFTWAYLEIRHGASYFRRALGVVVIFWAIASHFK